MVDGPGHAAENDEDKPSNEGMGSRNLKSWAGIEGGFERAVGRGGE
jgi:hypothetical protein